MKILIFGINGNLGKYLSKFFLNKNYNICFIDNLKEISFRFPNTKKVLEMITKSNPDIIINLVACTNIEECEINFKKAYSSNVLSVASIVRAINSNALVRKPHLIHLSTDHIYSDKGYNKESEVKLLNNYAFTKFMGEQAILNCSNTILRTNYIGKSSLKDKYSLGDWIINSLSKNKNITAYSNIEFNPVHIETLCKIIEIVCTKKINGVFNIGSSGSISKYDYAIFLAKNLSLNRNLIEKGLHKSSAVIRPNNMRMNIKKFEQIFDYEMPKIYNELIKNINDYHKL